MKKPEYLVRLHDCHIFDVDPNNGCYRSWSNRKITDNEGNRPTAYEHFTADNLMNKYGFIAITEDEIKEYEEKGEKTRAFINWQLRSDGHGGCKGGTYEEFLKNI